MKTNNWEEQDKEITEILLEFSEEENRQLRYENTMLRRLLQQQENNYREFINRIEESFDIERRLN